MLRRKVYDPKYDGKPSTLSKMSGQYVNAIRQHSPSVSRLLIFLLIGYIVIDHFWRGPATSGERKTGGGHGNTSQINKVDQQNPKIKGVKDLADSLKHVTDPQEQEFKDIIEYNKKLKNGEERKVPIYNPNAHIKEKHEKLALVNPNWKEQVIHPKPKEFPVSMLKTPQMECDDPLTLLFLVHTDSNNFGARKAIRLTWGSQDKYERFGPQIRWKTIFVMGKREAGSVAEREVVEESEKYGDILQANFDDNQHEGTRKIMSALSWLPNNVKNCRPKFIMKTTDRIFLNMFSIIDWLDNKFAGNVENIYTGKLLRLDRPVRDQHDPMYVPESDYSKEFLPNMIQDPVYLFDFNTYVRLSQHMRYITPMAMEDGYVGLLAESAGVKPKHNDHFQMLEQTSNACHNLRIFFIYNVNAYKHIQILDRNMRARENNECYGAKVINPRNNMKAQDIIQ